MRITNPDQRPSVPPARVWMTHGPVTGPFTRDKSVLLAAPATGAYGIRVSAADPFAGGALAVAPTTGEIRGVPPRGRPA